MDQERENMISDNFTLSLDCSSIHFDQATLILVVFPDFFFNYSMLVLPEGLLGLNPISEIDNNIPMLNKHAQQQTLCFL